MHSDSRADELDAKRGARYECDIAGAQNTDRLAGANGRSAGGIQLARDGAGSPKRLTAGQHQRAARDARDIENAAVLHRDHGRTGNVVRRIARQSQHPAADDSNPRISVRAGERQRAGADFDKPKGADGILDRAREGAALIITADGERGREGAGGHGIIDDAVAGAATCKTINRWAEAANVKRRRAASGIEHNVAFAGAAGNCIGRAKL